MAEPLSPQHRAARAWVRSGYHVFPCLPGAKEPAVSEGVYAATADAAQIDAWWTENPQYNPAVYPGATGHFVLDVDVKPTKDGNASLFNLEVEHGPLADTLVIRTPSGGRHIWFTGAVHSSVERVGSGLDIRGTGGYVLVPGAVVDGRPYVVEHSAPPQPGPAWLLAKAQPTQREWLAAADIPLDLPVNVQWFEGYLSREPLPVEGQGSDAQCFKIFCAAREHGISPDLALDMVYKWIGTFEHDWLEAKVINVYEYAQNGEGSKARPDPRVVFVIAGIQKAAGGLPDATGDIRDGGGDGSPRQAARTSRFALYSIRDMEAIETPEWGIEGWFPAHGTALLYGAYGAYKSFVATELALSRASGRAFYGVAAGPSTPVVYAAGEGFHGLVKHRQAAWRMKHDVPADVPFYAVKAVPHATPQDCQAFASEIAAAGLSPGLIILDTASRMMAPAGLDENKAVDAGRLVDAAEALANAFKPCLVVVIHHAGKDAGRGARGSSSLPAGFDVVIGIDADKDLRVATLTVEKQKDAEEPKPLRVKGIQIANALVFEPMAEGEYEAASAASESRVTKDELKAALNALEARDGKSVTTHVLALEVIRLRGVQLDEMTQQRAVKAVSADLEKGLQRGVFRGYVHGWKTPGHHWGYPAPEEAAL